MGALARRAVIGAATVVVALTGCGTPVVPDAGDNGSDDAGTGTGPADVGTGAGLADADVGTGTGTGTGTDAGTDAAPGREDRRAPATSDAPKVATGPAPDPEQSPGEPRPSDLHWVPPDDELDRMARSAEQAYRAHWEVFDTAARAGFADPALQRVLLSGAADETLHSLQLQAESVAGTGRVVEGGTQILGIDPIGLDPPVEGGRGFTMIFVACVLMEGQLLEPDGTVVLDLDWDDPQLLLVRLVDEDGSWLVAGQTEQGAACPADLLGMTLLDP